MEVDLTDECDILEAELKMIQNVPASIFPNVNNYYAEIHSIMYAFGDVKDPLEDSVKFMHNILQSQMALLINNAEEVMKLRNGKKISHQDVLFQMRKNKVLLKRLLQFLHVEDSKSRILQNVKSLDCEFKPENGKQVSECLKYLSFIEKFPGDLTSILRDESIVDHAYRKRMKRRFLMAESMTDGEYESFFEYTLRITFCSKYNHERFKSWLQESSSTTTDITPLALLIIHFLARETVAKIVDKALEIKSRKYEKNDSFQFKGFRIMVDQFYKSEQHSNSLKGHLQPLTSEVIQKFSDKKAYSSENITADVKLETAVPENNNFILHSSNDLQNMDKASECLDQNSSSSSCLKNKSSFDSDIPTSKRKGSKFLDDNLKKTKTEHNMCDNTKLHSEVPHTNSADESSSYTVRSEYSVIADCTSDEISKKTNQEPYFSLNFKEKKLSICYDGLKTFKINTSSISKSKNKKAKNTEETVLARSCFVEHIDESDLCYLKKEYSSCISLNDFVKHIGPFPFLSPSTVDYKIHWFPNEAIIPGEIQAAFIHYQKPPPMVFFLKSKDFDIAPKKAYLVCLASADNV